VTLRLLGYNIFRGGRNRRALAEVVRAVDPDLVVVNECPKAPLLWRAGCASLAEEWGMRVVAGGRPAGSNLLLARPGLEVRRSVAFRIPQPSFAPRRGVVAAQLRVEGRLLGVVGCHLSLDRDSHDAEVRAVVGAAAGLRGPVVLAGDLNEAPGGASWTRFARAGFVDPAASEPDAAQWATFPADAPRKRIDAVLVRGGLVVRHLGDPGVPADLLARASDHRPVLAEVELGR